MLTKGSPLRRMGDAQWREQPAGRADTTHFAYPVAFAEARDRVIEAARFARHLSDAEWHRRLNDALDALRVLEAPDTGT